MNTIDKIKAEIKKVLDAEGDSENARAQALALMWVLELIDKYAEQEKYCQECVKADDCVEYGTINCKWRVVKNDL